MSAYFLITQLAESKEKMSAIYNYLKNTIMLFKITNKTIQLSIWVPLRDAVIWQRPIWPILAWLAAIGVGTGLIYWAGVDWGLGATTDGLIYLSVARNIRLLGQAVLLEPGYRWHVVTLWPPGYPLAIAAFVPFARYLYPNLPQSLFLPAEIEARAAWLLHMFMLAFLLALIIREIYQTTRHLFPTAGLALLTAIAFPVLRIYTWVHSESIFLVQIFLAAWAEERWQTRPTIARAVLTGLLIAWSVTVRWIGIAMLPWIFTIHLLQHGTRVPQMRKHLLAFLLAAGFPIVALVGATILASGSVTGRTPGWYLPTQSDWLLAARTVATWLSPPFLKLTPLSWSLRSLSILAGAFGIILAGAWMRHAHSKQNAKSTDFFLRWSAWIGWYWLLFLISKIILEPKVEIKLRLLTPIYLPLLLMVGVAAWYLGRRHWWGFLLLLLAGAHMIRLAWIYDNFYIIRLWHNQGASWRMAIYQEAPFWRPLQNLPPYVEFYTNKWVVVDFYTGHPTRPLTSIPVGNQINHMCALFILIGNPETDAQLASWKRAFHARGFSLWGQWAWAAVYMPSQPTCAILQQKTIPDTP